MPKYNKPTITNVPMATAGQEYSFTIPDNTIKMQIKSRLMGTLKYAFVSGESGSNYITIPAGSAGKWIDMANLKDTTLYVQSDQASDVLEVETWK